MSDISKKPRVDKSRAKSLPILVGVAFCSHCGNNPGVKPLTDNTPPAPSPEGNDSSCVWNGFYDADTKEYVCWNCVQLHYEKKRITIHTGCYSEMPVTIAAVTDSAPPVSSTEQAFLLSIEKVAEVAFKVRATS